MIEILSLLFIIYAAFSAIGASWSGMNRFLRIIFAPGFVARDLLLSALGVRFYFIQSQAGRIPVISSEEPVKLIRIYLASALLLAASAAFAWASITVPKLLLPLLWLSASFFMASLPSPAELYALVVFATKDNPMNAIVLLWTVTVFLAFLYYYDAPTAIVTSAVYFFTALILCLRRCLRGVGKTGEPKAVVAALRG